jgi:hypothetical protein
MKHENLNRRMKPPPPKRAPKRIQPRPLVFLVKMLSGRNKNKDKNKKRGGG